MNTILPAVLALLLACFVGFLGTSWLLRELLAPIDMTADALRQYIETRQLPGLPAGFDDRAGKLMTGTQYTLSQLHETIGRLERVSASDALTGVYNRRAGERRLQEETARADRDRETFHVAFLDINRFKAVNDTHGHSAGDACISHVAQILEATTRRGDWVARWGGDEFVVGLHRNKAVKVVVGRILEAIQSTPCVNDDTEITVHVSCGVAEYRFGAGMAGVLAEADGAMYRAKELSRPDGRTRVRYWDDD
jgi:diguanylate cyclase (GGDEF)-like protein